MNKDTERGQGKRPYPNEYLILLAGIVLLVVMNFSVVQKILSQIISAFNPLLIGGMIAFVLDIPTDYIEKKILDRVQYPPIQKNKHLISFILALIITIGLVALVLNLIVPQVIGSVTVFIGKLPKAYDFILETSEKLIAEYPTLQDRIGETMPSTDIMLRKATTALSDWVGGAVNFLGSTLSNVFSLVFAFIFAIYIILGKKDLQRQIDRLLNWMISPNRKATLYRNLRVVNNTFEDFFVGQLIEAVIFGVLCTAGLYIFRFPYAAMIGTFSGLTALIPMVGALVGGAFGFIMIGSEDPIKGALFLIFIVVLQQLESNLIYPKVVGDKIGLPGIWVLAAVVVGGSLFGIGGTLLGVPVAATIYKFLAKKTLEEEEKAKLKQACQSNKKS